MNPKTNFNRKRLDQLIKELHQAGFHVTSGEGEFVVLGREPCRESGGHNTAIINAKGHTRRMKTVQISHEHLLYAVFPRKDWREHALACVERNDESWVQESTQMAGKTEPIFQRQGYLLGSVGGTPANYDYGSPDGQVVFMYIGNPFHISSPRLAKHWNFTAAWGDWMGFWPNKT